MQAMKGATVALGSMNRSMNLPALQRIAMEFERETAIMDERQEMMDDAIDDAMDVGIEEEGDEVVEQVLEEIGVDLNQAVSKLLAVSRKPRCLTLNSSERPRQAFNPRKSPKVGLPKLSVAPAAAVGIPGMTISRLVLTV